MLVQHSVDIANSLVLFVCASVFYFLFRAMRCYYSRLLIFYFYSHLFLMASVNVNDHNFANFVRDRLDDEETLYSLAMIKHL